MRSFSWGVVYCGLILVFLVSCSGSDGIVEVDNQGEQASDTNESVAVAETGVEDLSENKFSVSLGNNKALISAIFEKKKEEFAVPTTDIDAVIFEIKDKYSVSLDYVRDHLFIGKKSYFDYKQDMESGSAEQEKGNVPQSIVVELKASENKSSAEVLFASGNTNALMYNTLDKDKITRELADEYDMAVDDIKLLITFYNEGEKKPSDLAQTGLAPLVEKRDGILRSVSCEFTSHVISFDFMIDGNTSAILYGADIGPYSQKRVMRFKLNSQDLKALKCGPKDAPQGSTLEFEPRVLYSCTNRQRGVYWTGEDERYADKEDILAIQIIGGYDQIRFKCE